MLQKLRQSLSYTFWLYIFLSLLVKSYIFVGFILEKSHLSSDFPEALGRNYQFAPFYCGIIAIFLSFAFLLRNKLHQLYLIFLDLIISILMIIDLWYYRGFNSMPSIQVLNQTSNLNNMQDSIMSLIHPVDFIMIFDIPVVLLIMLVLSFIKKDPFNKINRSVVLFAAAFVISCICIVFIPVKIDVFSKKTMDTQTACASLSPVGYHIYNIYTTWRDSKAAVLSSSDLDEIGLWFEQKKELLPDNKYKGIFSGKNLIFIQFESLEKFVVGQKYEDQEITPNLNKLLKNALFFTNIYEQNNQGNSSDADLMNNTSMYPVRQGSTFFTYSNTTYPGSLPKLFERKGYSTLAIHPDEGSFWNWMPSLQSIGFQETIGAEHFVMDETFLLGLADESFFRQAFPFVAKEKQPFYTFMVTLSSHSPFNIPYYHRTLNLKNGYNENIMEFYFQSMHYTDGSIGSFIDSLDKGGFLDNTVVVVCGDHAGVNKYHQAEINELNPKEEWWELSKKQIPVIIYSKGLQPEQFNITGGQVDVLPTLSYLFGMDENEVADTSMGRNLLKTEKDFAVLADGSIVGKTLSEKDKEQEIKGLDISDTIIKSNYFIKSVN